MTSLNEEQKRKIIQHLNDGKNYREISTLLNISPVQVALFLSKACPTIPNVNSEKPIVTDIAVKVKNRSKDEGDVLIGYSDNAEPVYWNPFKSPNPHLMIVGESGFGKTYGITGIICEMARMGIPSIVIDYSRSYEVTNFPKKFQTEKKFQEINVASKGISLNPLEIRESDIKGPLSVAVRISGTFNRIYNIGVHQESLLRDVILEVYCKKGINENDQNTWKQSPPHLSDLYRELKIISEDEHDPRQKYAETTYSHISNFFVYNTFNPEGEKFDWDNAINSGKISILQLNGLDGKTKKVVIEFLLWDIFGFINSKGPNPLKWFVVLDEAHNLSFKPDTPIDKIVREARKFGLGAILASQHPEDFSGSVFGNTGTKIFFQVSEEKSKFVKRIATKCKRDPNKISELLSTMPKGKAFVLADNNGYKCKIASFAERGLE